MADSNTLPLISQLLATATSLSGATYDATYIRLKLLDGSTALIPRNGGAITIQAAPVTPTTPTTTSHTSDSTASTADNTALTADAA